MKNLKVKGIIASLLDIVKDIVEGKSPERYDHIADYLVETMIPALRALAKKGESYE